MNLFSSSHDCGNTADTNNGSPLSIYQILLDHLLSNRLREEECSVQIDRLCLQVELGGERKEWVKCADAGIGNQRVDAAICLDGCLDNLVLVGG